MSEIAKDASGTGAASRPNIAQRKGDGRESSGGRDEKKNDGGDGAGTPRELLAKFLRAVDQGDAEGVACLFQPGGSWNMQINDSGRQINLIGHKMIMRFVLGLPSPPSSGDKPLHRFLGPAPAMDVAAPNGERRRFQLDADDDCTQIKRLKSTIIQAS
uniref:Uncharacterized protein n=1 Tax=Lotharella oceanica TaxID=641309 RepID=A0A7S2TIF3_9EUKA|mmetsp:Transcript_15663/g.29726  ORF Transcript_15663/g.29726 Transcript_15663/m.29726 type:complete len:158 (+) Transcript_15663:137-610(+)